MLALVVKGPLVEAFEEKLELLLEQLAVGLSVEERRAERLHFTRVIAASHPHDHAAVGHDIGHGIILSQADRMPHREDIEGAAELEPPGLGGEPEAELDQVRKALIALALEMVLGGPQHIVAQPVHGARDVAGGGKDLAQPLIGVATVIGRRARKADIVELDLADIEDVEALDHGAASLPAGCAVLFEDAGKLTQIA